MDLFFNQTERDQIIENLYSEGLDLKSCPDHDFYQFIINEEIGRRNATEQIMGQVLVSLFENKHSTFLNNHFKFFKT